MAGLAGAAIAITGAPPAVAGPAPGYVESSYLLGLADHGYAFDTAKGRTLAVKLGYLVCTLDLIGGAQPAGAEVFLSAAQSRGLCSYVSVAGQPSAAQIREDFGRQVKTALDLGVQQGDQRQNGVILQTPPDFDGDGVPDSVDSEPRYYNP